MKLLHNLTFLNAVVLQGRETASVTIRETEDDGIEWVCEKDGFVQTAAKAERAELAEEFVHRIDIPDFSNYQKIEGTEIYSKKSGIYDKEIQCISHVYKKDKEAWGFFEYQQIKQSVKDEISLSALLLDAAFLCRLAFYTGKETESGIPFFIKTVKIIHPLENLSFCRVLEKTSDAQNWEGDISLFTSDGEQVIIMEHIVFRSGGKTKIDSRKQEDKKHPLSHFLAKETDMKDHVIEGRPLLAGVMYPAVAAELNAENTDGAVVTGLTDLLWRRPVELGNECEEISIYLKRRAYGLTYEQKAEQGTIYGNGRIEYGAYEDSGEYFEDAGILVQCVTELKKQEFYDLLSASGYQYGARFTPVESVSHSDTEAVGVLRIPAEWGIYESFSGYAPAVLEGGLQIAGYLANRKMPQHKSIMPFSLQSLKIIMPMKNARRVFVKLKEDGTTAELKFYEDGGRLVAVASNYRMRPVKNKIKSEKLQIPKSSCGNKDIAIIGMAGVMPGCEDLDEFWEALKEKRTLTGNASEERTRLQKGLLPVRAGFLKQVDSFDHSFFDISPREAELMDPQQRIALETVWKAIEDSGYSVKDFSGSNMGVFIGVAGHDYRHLLDQGSVESEAQALTGNAHNILTGRISYLLNLKGPSEPVDTACSSALQAVQHAISSIREGRCETALAGGINVIADDSLFHSFSDLGILSKSGVCRVFDKASDGMIRGEGAGIFLLKSLQRAEEDGDHIWAVIKGSATGHGGRTYSLTAPGKDGQTEVMISALKDADIEPDTVSFIEAHGTGTPLGDPIEIDALKEVYQRINQKKCAIGTVKSSVGHLETASGAAGILKVILCMQHETLPGNAEFEQLSPHINLSKSGLYILENTEPWKRQQDENGCVLPLRAGISSFGLSGVNAHLILESYDKKRTQSAGEGPGLFILSAKTEWALREYCRRLNRAIISGAVDEQDLSGLAYTLQKSRGDMRYRAAFIASSISELKHELQDFLGRAETYEPSGKNPGEENYNTISVKDRTLEEIADLWKNGSKVADWELLYEKIPVKLSLPTYPFEKHSHWIGIRADKVSETEDTVTRFMKADEITYSFSFHNKHRFLEEHIVNGMSVLPAVAYLELVRSAGCQGSKFKEIKTFRNLVWKKGIVMERNTLSVQCRLKGGEWYRFRIGTQEQPDCMSGECSDLLSYTARENVERSSWMEQCAQQLDKEQFYTALNRVGFCYGSLFQPIQRIHFQDLKAISEINIPKIAEQTDSEVMASVLEGALQTAGYLVNNKRKRGEGIFLPYSIRELHLFHPVRTAAFATAELKSENDREELDLQISDRIGRILAEINGYRVKLAGMKKEKEIECFTTVWKKAGIESASYENHSILVLFAEEEYLYHKIKKNDMQIVVWVKPASAFNKISTEKFEADIFEEKDYKRLSAALSGYAGNGLSILYVPRLPEIEANFYEAVEETVNRMILPLFYINKHLRNMKDGEYFSCKCFYPYLNPAAEALSGFVKSLNLELGRSIYQCIGFDDLKTGEAAILHEICDHSQISHIRYIKGVRYMFSLQKTFLTSVTHKSLYAYGGTYWITGGGGKLGMLLAQYFSDHYGAYVFISGRRPVTDEILEKINLYSGSGQIQYIQADVTKMESVKSAYEEIKRSAGSIDGIIHCAGLTDDALAVNKTPEKIWNVISPKVNGTVLLDEVTKKENIRWFLLFSSITGVVGNLGQTDYAYANCFMECYAQYRNSLSLKGQRKGRAAAVNWPYIEGGGMIPPSENLLYGKNASIDGALSVKDAFDLLETPKLYEHGSITVLPGNENEFAEIFHGGGLNQNCKEKQQNQADMTEKMIVDLIVDITHMKREEVLPDTNLEYCGFDSVVMAEFTKKMREMFQIDISPAFFFEIGEVNPWNICKYLKDNYNIK